MRCPKCYGKVDKEAKICTKCGFRVEKLKEASNKKAKELMRSGDGDLVIQTKSLPSDLSKKKLALWCGFLGLFGAHYFYVGKMFKGFLNLVISLFAFIFVTLSTLKILATGFLQYVEYFFMLGFAIVFINTIFDFINILLNRFNVPVYVEEK